MADGGVFVEKDGNSGNILYHAERMPLGSMENRDLTGVCGGDYVHSQVGPQRPEEDDEN